MAHTLSHDEVFLVLFGVLFLAVVATLPIDNPVTGFAHDLVGAALFAIVGGLAAIGAASGIIVGLLSLGFVGWLGAVLLAVLLFREFSWNLVLVSLFFLAMMLLL